MAEFLADVMCGKLATYLRMCGHDTAYALDRGIEADDEILATARAEDRVLVTRDESLAARTERAVLLTAMDPVAQLRELAAAGYDCTLSEPSRCSACNGRLERVEGGETPDYAPGPAEEAVWRCRDCGQHFWKGSHWDDVRERLN
ncbi:MAG: Mut7-C RNAse domain-containing protein [Halobacteriaceae archaeon]